MARRLTYEEVKMQISELNSNITLLSKEYKNCMTKMDFECHVCGNIWKTRLTDIKQGIGCPVCGKNKSIKTGKDRMYTIEKIIELTKEYKPNLEIISTEYLHKNDRATVKCKICGYEWTMIWRKIYEKSSKSPCPCCSGLVPSDKNSIESIRPDLMKYLKNKDDAKLYSIWSHKTIPTICPICKNEKDMMVMNITRHPYSCNICGDTVSKPEKFMSNILKNIGIEYEYQKKFEWSEGKIYDFYIPSLNIIIETHGGQHYKNVGFSRDLEYQQEVDYVKKNNAILNGINKYVEINCSKSDLKYMKKNIIKELKNILDFSNINFEDCYEFCNTTYLKHISDLLIEGKDEEYISNELKLNMSLIKLYIIRAKNLKII